MKKPSIYLDTNVLSAYWYEGHDVLALARRILTYLLTWNYAHLANPEAQRRLEYHCREAGYRAPIMVTAQSIPKIKQGQDVRRDPNDDC